MDPRFFVNPSAFKDPSKIGAPSAMQGGALPSGIDGRFFVNPSAFSNPSKVGAPSALQGGAKRPRRSNAAHIDARFFVQPIDFSDPSKIGAPSAMMTGGKRPHELLEDGLTQMQGGARTTIEAGAAALLHPKDAIEELKSMFKHIGQIFSSTDIGGNIRVHLLPAVQILIKYLPLGGPPGYAAAVALERLLPRAGKIIELIATIMDFFTGRKDFFQLLGAFKDMVEDLWHQFVDIIPKVMQLVGSKITEGVKEVQHATSEAIGKDDNAVAFFNAFGSTYETTEQKRQREKREAEARREQAFAAAAQKAVTEVPKLYPQMAAFMDRIKDKYSWLKPSASEIGSTESSKSDFFKMHYRLDMKDKVDASDKLIGDKLYEDYRDALGGEFANEGGMHFGLQTVSADLRTKVAANRKKMEDRYKAGDKWAVDYYYQWLWNYDFEHNDELKAFGLQTPIKEPYQDATGASGGITWNDPPPGIDDSTPAYQNYLETREDKLTTDLAHRFTEAGGKELIDQSTKQIPYYNGNGPAAYKDTERQQNQAYIAQENPKLAAEGKSLDEYTFIMDKLRPALWLRYKRVYKTTAVPPPGEEAPPPAAADTGPPPPQDALTNPFFGRGKSGGAKRSRC